jgi:MoxR-like ATPase
VTITEVKALSDAISENIARVVIGKADTTELIVAALFAKGHILLEDVPGTGKTVTAKSLAKSIDCNFSRIQFTPDLLPSDVTGLSVYDRGSGSFKFSPGPVFTNILLADEINRATPRTQSALLECMEERQVTTDGETRTLDAPFLVIATENPVEQSGTYALPEAQMDRFLMRLTPGYPDREGSLAMLDRFITDSPLETLGAVASGQQIVQAQEAIVSVRVSAPVREYIVSLAEATRTHDEVSLGVSPRGTLSMLRACQALAAVRGRDYVLPDDVRALAEPVFAHRLVLRSGYGSSRTSGDVIADVLKIVPVPSEEV